MVYTTMIYGTSNRYWTGRRRSHQQGTLRSPTWILHQAQDPVATLSLGARFGDHRWLGTFRGHKEATLSAPLIVSSVRCTSFSTPLCVHSRKSLHTARLRDDQR